MPELLSQIDFGSEAADDTDADELASYFVEQEMFLKFLDSRRRLLVVELIFVPKMDWGHNPNLQMKIVDKAPSRYPERIESFSPGLGRFLEGLPWVTSFKILNTEGVESIPNIPFVKFNFVSSQ